MSMIEDLGRRHCMKHPSVDLAVGNCETLEVWNGRNWQRDRGSVVAFGKCWLSRKKSN